MTVPAPTDRDRSAGEAASNAASEAAGEANRAFEGTVASEFDAGEMSCGELVLALRIRMRELVPGTVLHLIAHDLGAPADIPAWCRLTGHTLLKDTHPNYWIRRKPS